MGRLEREIASRATHGPAGFGKGCRQDTKRRLAACFDDDCRRVKPCGIIKRVQLEDDGASYCAGQDYPSEIALVRKILIASY
jgi:hypothetical protein